MNGVRPTYEAVHALADCPNRSTCVRCPGESLCNGSGGLETLAHELLDAWDTIDRLEGNTEEP